MGESPDLCSRACAGGGCRPSQDPLTSHPILRLTYEDPRLLGHLRSHHHQILTGSCYGDVVADCSTLECLADGTTSLPVVGLRHRDREAAADETTWTGCPHASSAHASLVEDLAQAQVLAEDHDTGLPLVSRTKDR